MADNPQLDPEDVAALKEMAQWWRNRGDGAMSRRRLLGLLGGAGLGAASVGGFFAGEASAGTDSVGQIGTQSEPADAVLEDVYDDGGNNPVSFPGDGSVGIVRANIIEDTSIIQPAAPDGTIDQNIAHDTQETVALKGDAYLDNLGILDASNNQLVIQEDGSYQIHIEHQWRSDSNWSTGDALIVYPAGDFRELLIGLNPDTVGQRKIGTNGETKSIAFTDGLQAGDRVPIKAYQDSGSTQTLGSSEPRRTAITVTKIG